MGSGKVPTGEQLALQYLRRHYPSLQVRGSMGQLATVAGLAGAGTMLFIVSHASEWELEFIMMKNVVLEAPPDV